MKNTTRSLLLAASVFASGAALAQPVAQDTGDIPRPRASWPAGYIDPGQPMPPYMPANTPLGSGPYKAIMATEPGAEEFVAYYPADLAALGNKKLPVLVWGNGSCTYIGNKFRHFLTDIASHGYFVLAGGPMGKPDNGKSETITIASNPPIPKPGEAPAPARPANPNQKKVTVALLTKGIDWTVAENERKDSKFYHKLDTSEIAVMGQSCGAKLAGSFGPDKRVKTLGIWSGGNPDLRDKITVPVMYITGDVKYDEAYPKGLDDFQHVSKEQAFYAWRTNMSHLGTYRQTDGGELAPVAVAWLDWQLKHDQAAARMFKGANCALCTNKNWHVQKKNID